MSTLDDVRNIAEQRLPQLGQAVRRLEPSVVKERFGAVFASPRQLHYAINIAGLDAAFSIYAFAAPEYRLASADAAKLLDEMTHERSLGARGASHAHYTTNGVVIGYAASRERMSEPGLIGFLQDFFNEDVRVRLAYLEPDGATLNPSR